AARLDEADDRLLLGEREQDVRLGDDVDAVIRQILDVGRIAEGDASADRQRLDAEAALDERDAPRRERTLPVGLGRGRGDARLRRRRKALRVRLGARTRRHHAAGGGADVVHVGVDHPVGVARHLRLGGVEEHLARRDPLGGGEGRDGCGDKRCCGQTDDGRGVSGVHAGSGRRIAPPTGPLTGACGVRANGARTRALENPEPEICMVFAEADPPGLCPRPRVAILGRSAAPVQSSASQAASKAKS
ncbi:MAG: hypothetical protein ACK55I_11855, partial [bacterium]